MRQRSLETAQSNKTIMAVGGEECNLNESLIISCLKDNRQKHSIQAICVRATDKLFLHKIQ
jgi:hypothetical protein